MYPATIDKVISELELYNDMKLVLALTSGQNFINCITLLFYDEEGHEFYIYGNRYDYLSDTKKDDSHYRILFRKLLDEAFDDGSREYAYCNLHDSIKMVTKNNDLSLFDKKKYTRDNPLIFMCEGMNDVIREWYTNSLPTKKEHRQKLIKIVLDE